ncbi:MAG: asparagine synthase (glutamine-hydrolyzing) [Terriglobales bacterium]
MCGIAGIVDYDGGGEVLRNIVSSMTQTLAHRGPDGSDVWVDAGTPSCALGHRRLAIIDLSPTGAQPMLSASGRYAITFNGEIYNFRELRTELQSHAAFRGISDTEVMLAGFETWGIEPTLKRLNGMFAFAVWDRRDRTLYLARDRFGEKPLYYGWMRNGFLFGSELKALAAHQDFVAEVDAGPLPIYLRLGYIPAPFSIYKGVRKLPQAHFLVVKPGEQYAEPQPYWSLLDVAGRGVRAQFTGTAEEATEELERLLLRAVSLRMISDVPLGALLSGGVDSSTVVALMQEQSRRPVRTFSIGFREFGFDESAYARPVARHLGTDHTELQVTAADALAVVPRLPVLYDEPFADASQIPTTLVAGLARRSVTVALSGDSGDEVFAGYNRHLWHGTIQRLAAIPHPARRAAAAAMTSLSPAQWDRLLRVPGRLSRATQAKGENVYKFAGALKARTPRDVYLHYVGVWPDAHKAVLAGDGSDLRLDDLYRWPDFPDFVHQMMYMDMMTYMADDILVKVDRASMSVALETRVPFLDPDVVEFAWRLPLSMKISGRTSKWILRQILYRRVPKNMVDRPKMGFAFPIAAWLRSELRDWAEPLLSSDALRDNALNPLPIRRKWKEHLSGRRNWNNELWHVLMYQQWMTSSPLARKDTRTATMDG